MKKAENRDKLDKFKTSNQQPAHRRANNIRVVDLTSSDDEDPIAYTLKTTTSKSSSPTVKLVLLKHETQLTVDTGSTVTIIDTNTYIRIGRPELTPTKTKIFVYASSSPLKLRGKFTTTLTHNGVTYTETVYVAYENNSGCILGSKASEELGLVQVSNIRQVKTTPEPLSKLKDYKIKLHIDPNVKPVAERHRRIPHNLRPEVEKEIQRLEQQDIIEKVSGPTPWVSPVVIVPRGNGIRICVDMRRPNKAIERERHITPTIDDIMSAVSGSRYFSKLDLLLAYHQLELAEESRYITTFSTHLGLRRYKRLFFGVTSAAEIFQNTIAELISDLDGVINASDDILVHGKTIEEHDSRFKKLEQRLRDNNLTVNESKRIFRQQKIKFYGVILSERGLELDPEKTKIVREFQPPTTKAEVRSFLGMVNYCAKFIDHYS